jgi:hypothetical protein
MDETRLEELAVNDGTVQLEILPHKIESILFIK